MKKNSALAGFCGRFQNILDALDEFEPDENLEELNAQFEDILFMMDCIDEEDPDAAEEISDAFEDLEDLLADYGALSLQRPELGQKITELEMILKMAQNNL